VPEDREADEEKEGQGHGGPAETMALL